MWLIPARFALPVGCAQVALRPFLDNSMSVAALEVVVRRDNEQPQASYMRRQIRNRLSCHHQDIRTGEQWFARVSVSWLSATARSSMCALQSGGERMPLANSGHVSIRASAVVEVLGSRISPLSWQWYTDRAC